MLFAAERQALLANVLFPANRAVGAVDDVSVDDWFCGLTASSALRCCGCFGHCVSPGCFPNAPGYPGASVKNSVLLHRSTFAFTSTPFRPPAVK